MVSKSKQHPTYVSHAPSGVTLFELILALALSAVILIMLGSAIHIHMRAIDTEQSDVESSQLARAILQQMSVELRGTVNTALLTSDDSSAAVSSTVDEIASSNATDPATDDATSTEDSAESQALDLSQPTAPGLYGTDSQLYFDVDRAMPTLNDPTMTLAGQPMGQLQRIAYFIGSATANTTTLSSNNLNANSGLIRRAVDHAVAEWSVLNGSNTTDALGTLIAPEVVGLTFRYFDGLQWASAWDSQQQAGLPVAVEITITIVPPLSDDDLEPATNAATSTLNGNAVNTFIFQTTVALPASLPTDQVQETY